MKLRRICSIFFLCCTTASIAAADSPAMVLGENQSFRFIVMDEERQNISLQTLTITVDESGYFESSELNLETEIDYGYTDYQNQSNDRRYWVVQVTPPEFQRKGGSQLLMPSYREGWAYLIWDLHKPSPATPIVIESFTLRGVRLFVWVDNQLFLGVHAIDKENSTCAVELIDLQTGESSVHDCVAWKGAGLHALRLDAGRFHFKTPGLEDEPVPFAPPEMLSPEHGTDFLMGPIDENFVSLVPLVDRQTTYIHDLRKNTWRKFPPPKGDANHTFYIGSWRMTEIGWTYPESDRFGPAMTGEVYIRNLKNDSMQNVFYEVLYICPDYLIARAHDNLMYIPTIDDYILERDTYVILKSPLVPKIKQVHPY